MSPLYFFHNDSLNVIERMLIGKLLPLSVQDSNEGISRTSYVTFIVLFKRK